MNYKIVTKYVKDLSFEIFNAKSYFLLEKNIKDHRFVCDINSKKVKAKIFEVNVSLRLAPLDKNIEKSFEVSVELSSLVEIEGDLEKEELEKIILVKVPTDVYPQIRQIIVFLFEKSGFNKINIDDQINFLKLYEDRKNQK
tara:strand:+ start:1347 stop:1769 length:423 start_codon:yes stop_codon:yes gene_type:complete